MSTHAKGRPDPTQVNMRHHTKSGLVDIELTLREHEVFDCKRCPERRCAEKLQRAHVDHETGLVTCRHRKPLSQVNAFIWGPLTAEPNHNAIALAERTGWPMNASYVFRHFLGGDMIMFVWSNEAWESEQDKPDAWPVRDGRILIVPATPQLNIRPRIGRADRFHMAENLDVEMTMPDWPTIVYTVTLRADDATPSAHTVTLSGNGGVARVEIKPRIDLSRALDE
jgi:hypothetical protein